MEKQKIQKSGVSDIFFVKQKFIQFLNHGMSKLPYYRRSMGKDNFQALPYRFRVESPNFHKVEIFCGMPYHFQGVGFAENYKYFSHFMKNI